MKISHLLFTISLVLSILFAGNSSGQHITSAEIYSVPGMDCSQVAIKVKSDVIDSEHVVRVYWGDEYSAETTFPAGSDSVILTNTYGTPGVYTVRVQLLSGWSAGFLDSTSFSYSNLDLCKYFCLSLFHDENGDCLLGSDEHLIHFPVSVAVDSNGVRVDTILAPYGFYYHHSDHIGDVYRFSIIGDLPVGVACACPATGVIYDTVQSTSTVGRKLFGLNCSGAGGLDLGVTATSRTGGHLFISNIEVANQFCEYSAPVTLTVHFSSKYNYYYSTSTVIPSISGNVYTWVFPSISSITPLHVDIYGSVFPYLSIFDTVHTSYFVDPTAGDVNPANNAIIVIDTVVGSFDPNNKSVSPSGDIHPGPGTTLTYTINFENTGNDTAFNIHIMDVLSPYVDPHSLRVIAASAPVYTYKYNDGTHNGVKFDFPNINLLDSSHHGLCDGFVRYSIKTYDNLPLGVPIQNTADIYFDYNEPITTNTTVTNVVDWPAGVAGISTNGDLVISPNPAGDNIDVSITSGNYNTIQVCDLLGRNVLSADVAGSVTRLNIATIPSGNYIITLKGKDGVKVKQFVKM